MSNPYHPDIHIDVDGDSSGPRSDVDVVVEYNGRFVRKGMIRLIEYAAKNGEVVKGMCTHDVLLTTPCHKCTAGK